MSSATRRGKHDCDSHRLYRNSVVRGVVLVGVVWFVRGLLLEVTQLDGIRNSLLLMPEEKKISFELEHFRDQVATSSLEFPLQNFKNISVDGREANIAFFIQISESNIILVPRLLWRIWHPENIYCLHIDIKISPHTKKLFEDMLNSHERFKNVFLLPSSPVTYAGISMVLNTLDSIETLLDLNQSWDYYINLSGSDYPLVSPIGIRRLFGQVLATTNQTSFIHFSTVRSSWDKLLRHRLKVLHFDPTLGFNPRPEKQLIQTFTKHPLVSSKDINITIPKGEAWIIAHRSFCHEVITGTLSRRILTLFANMQSSAEHFFQTVAWNHPGFNDTTARDSLRFVRWKTADGKASRQHPVYLDDHSESRKWLYWDTIRASRDLFARKFRLPNSPLMEHIDRYVSGMGENADASSVEYFFRRVNRHLNCVASETQQIPIECRNQGMSSKPPRSSPVKPAKPSI